jgi:hypothetical protein
MSEGAPLRESRSEQDHEHRQHIAPALFLARGAAYAPLPQATKAGVEVRSHPVPSLTNNPIESVRAQMPALGMRCRWPHLQLQCRASWLAMDAAAGFRAS